MERAKSKELREYFKIKIDAGCTGGHRGMGILPMHRRLSPLSESSFRQGRRWRNKPCEEIVISGARARRPCHDGCLPAAASFLWQKSHSTVLKQSLSAAVYIALVICALPFITAATCASDFTYRGIAYISYQPDEYTTPDSTASIDDLAGTGANWASLLTTWFMRNGSDTLIAPEAANTPTDAGLIQAISDMHARGLHVMLKPQVDVDGGLFRGLISPSDTNAWFTSYTAFITHYAALAKAQNVELFCIGCEFTSMTGSANQAQWTAVIQSVRAVYDGPLTYAANAFAIADEYANVPFWPQLDLAGLDCYTPLTNHTDPSVAELVAAWRNDKFGQDMVAALTAFQASVGKPVFFSEMGYQSIAGANINPPFMDFSSGPADQQEQANCYEAALDVWSAQPWCRGIFWWGWKPSLPPDGDKDFSARGKLAQTVLENFFATLNNPPVFTSPASATPAAVQIGEAVSFAAAATDPDGDGVEYSWDFGDTTNDTGSSVAHAYLAAGIYTAIVTASDGKGGAVSSQVNVTVSSSEPPKLFFIKQASIKLDFKHSNRDSLQFSGSLPLAAATPLGATAIVSVDGIVRTIQAGAKPSRNPKAAAASLIIGKLRKGIAAFTLKLERDTLAPTLAAAGFGSATVRKQKTPFTATIILDSAAYQATRVVLYSAQAGKSGAAH